MTTQSRKIQRYITPDGKIPIDEWLDSFRDSKTKAIINARIKRVNNGNLGNYRSLGDSIYELKINYGAGYRVYFGQVGTEIILLLSGGDKSTQDRDIHKAKEYWRDYEQRKNTP